MLQNSKDDGQRKEFIDIMESEVENAKSQNLPIIRAFESISERTGLKVNTVRNYYYRYINSLIDRDEKDGEKEHTKAKKRIGRPFTEEEVYDLMTKMLIAQGQGKSVRGCANEMSNGDNRLLIRYQNKYRNVIANKVGYVESLMEQMAGQGETFYNPYTKEYIINGKTSSYDNYRSQEKFDRMFKETVESLAKIQDMTLGQLMNGIWNISGKLVDEDTVEDKSVEYESLKRERDNLKKTVKEYENKIDEENWKVVRLLTMLKQFVTVNKNFLSLSESDRDRELESYLFALRGCMDIYEAIEGDSL